MSATNDLTNSIIDYIRRIGGKAWRNNTGAMRATYTDKRGDAKERFMRFGEKGSGDVLALHRGTFYSIEVKTGRDQLNENQMVWIDDVNAHGGVAFEARSIDDVMARVR